MRIPDLAASVAVAALGAFLMREGGELGLGSAVEPGSGFMFWWIGVALLAAAAGLAGLALLARPDPGAQAPPGGRWIMALVCVGAMIAYAAVLEPVGFIPSSAALLAFLFAAVDRYRLPVALGLGVVLSLGAWLLFAKLLSSNLPPGLLAGTALGI